MHNVLDECISITRASGRGLGPGYREFFGPCEMSMSRKASAIWGPKNSRGEHSRKEPFEQLVNGYSEHLHMSVITVENACKMAPSSACVT